MDDVKWEYDLANDEEAEMCAVQKLECRLRVQRLRWSGHVVRREEGQIMRSDGYGSGKRKT